MLHAAVLADHNDDDDDGCVAMMIVTGVMVSRYCYCVMAENRTQ